MIKQVTLFFLSAIAVPLCAQQPNTNFPSSPNSNAIEKMGNIPVDYYNGSLPIQLPLPSLTTKNGFELPIYVQYNSNGIKVNDYPGTMGMSWSMFAGGYISRNILGADDFSSNGYYHQPMQFPDAPISDSCNAAGSNYWNQMIQLSNQGKSPFTPDARPDEFFFHAAGLHGKFQYLPNRTPSFIPFTNAQVFVNYSQIGVPGQQSLSFKMFDEQLNVYHFNAMELNTLSYLPGGNPLGPYISAVYLTDIVTKDGEQIHFEYENFSYTYQLQAQDVFSASPACGHFSEHEKTIQVLKVETPILREISYHNQHIQFNYNSAAFFNNKQLLLESIAYSNASTLVKKYNFYYDLHPLKERAWLVKMEQVPVGLFNGINPSYDFEYFYPDSLPQRLSLKQDYWGFYNNNSNAISLAPTIPNNLFQSDCNISNDQIDTRPLVSRITDTLRIQFGSLKKIIYPTGGTSVFDLEAHKFTHPDLSKYALQDTMYGAGLRVRQISNYDVDGKLLLRKNIKYHCGFIMSVPLHFYQSVHSCGALVSFRFNSCSSPVLQTQYAAKGQLVGYSQVDEFLVDSFGNSNGKISRNFFNQVSKQSEPISIGSRWRSSAFYLPVFDFQNSMLFYHPNTPINNQYSTKNGTLLAEKIYANHSGQFDLIEQTEFLYESISLPKIKGKIAQYPICQNNTFLDCDFLIYYQYENNTDWYRLKQKNNYKYARGIQGIYASLSQNLSETFEYDPTLFYRIIKHRKGNALLYESTVYSYLVGNYQVANNYDFFRPTYLESVAHYRNDFLLSKKSFVYNSEWQCVKQIQALTNQQHQLVQAPLQYETSFNYHADRSLSSQIDLPHTQTCFVWDQVYDKIAVEVKHADTDDFAYSSFEPGLFHRINDVRNFTEFTETAKTGRWVFNLSQSNLFVSLKPNTYILSFWFKGPSDQVQLDIQNAKIISKSVSGPDLSEWLFFECIFKNDNTIVCTLSGDLQLDEFKVHPFVASMKTTTYSAQGIQAVSEPNHSIVYYDYDALGNLSSVANSEGSIIKSIQTNFIH